MSEITNERGGTEFWKDVTEEQYRDTSISLDRKDDIYGDWKAFVKFDGCVDIYEDDEGFHICDLDRMIGRLQEIKRRAVARFGEDWGE